MTRALIISALFASAARTDWPQWRGPTRDSTLTQFDLPEKFPAEFKPRWRKPLGGGYSGPAVSAGRVTLFAYHRSPKEQEHVLCLDVRSGDVLWEHRYDVDYQKLDYGKGPRATPTIHQGRVYTFGARGRLHCFDAKTGKVIWDRDCAKDFKARKLEWGHSSSPLIDGDRVIVQVGGEPNACIVALNADTGKEVWRALSDRAGYASPVLVAGKGWRQLVYFLPERVVGLDPTTGKEVWRVAHEAISYDVSISDAVEHRGVLLVGDYWTGSRALEIADDGKSAKLLWKGKQLSLLMSTPLCRDGHAYALDRFRGLKCVELRTGKVLWQDEHVTPRGRNPQASLVWVGERALIFNENCELILARLTPEKYEALGKGKVPLKSGFTWAHPAFAEGCIFVRDDEEIVCVPLRN